MHITKLICLSFFDQKGNKDDSLAMEDLRKCKKNFRVW